MSRLQDAPDLTGDCFQVFRVAHLELNKDIGLLLGATYALHRTVGYEYIVVDLIAENPSLFLHHANHLHPLIGDVDVRTHRIVGQLKVFSNVLANYGNPAAFTVVKSKNPNAVKSPCRTRRQAARMKVFLDRLPEAQQALWPRLRETPPHFVLYGGTAVALRLGNRVSEDFDFFSNAPFQPAELQAAVPYLRGAPVRQSVENTLTCTVGSPDPVKVSFFGELGIRTVQPPDVARDNGIQIASLLDLAGAKAIAVQSRARCEDYVDLAAIIESGIPLVRALSAAASIFGSRDFNPVITLKALSYYDDPGLRGLPDSARDTLWQAVRETRLGDIHPLRTRPSILASDPHER